jgi:hypothetical protein
VRRRGRQRLGGREPASARGPPAWPWREPGGSHVRPRSTNGSARGRVSRREALCIHRLSVSSSCRHRRRRRQLSASRRRRGGLEPRRLDGLGQLARRSRLHCGPPAAAAVPSAHRPGLPTCSRRRNRRALPACRAVIMARRAADRPARRVRPCGPRVHRRRVRQLQQMLPMRTTARCCRDGTLPGSDRRPAELARHDLVSPSLRDPDTAGPASR